MTVVVEGVDREVGVLPGVGVGVGACKEEARRLFGVEWWWKEAAVAAAAAVNDKHRR